MVSYLSVRSKFPIQSYTQRVDQSTEKMRVSFLPPGVKESGREADSDLVVHAKERKIWSHLKDSGGFHHLIDIFSWLLCVFEEQLRGELTKTKLAGYEGWIVELISWEVARKEGAYIHFATTMMKFDWKDTGLDEGIEDYSCCLVQIAWFKLKFEWEVKLIVLILVIG